MTGTSKTCVDKTVQMQHYKSWSTQNESCQCTAGYVYLVWCQA